VNSNLNRREFLKRTAMAAGAAALLPGCAIVRPRRVGDRLNCAQIGCGSRGMYHLEWLVVQSKENVVAIVDADESRHAVAKKWLKEKNQDPTRIRFFTDYRVMFDKLGKHLDAVFIATPNHQHASPAMLAMQSGIGVFCEKPLCHDIGEARKLREMAARSKAPTQMGNQGHCMDGYRRLCEFVWAGIVDNITETHSWTDRANGGAGPRPPSSRAPAGLHWDKWIGPAPYRNFHAGLHPHEWHGWDDFGNGAIGNMGCHVLDGACWALNLEHPVSVEAEYMRGGSDERFPLGSRLRWDFPARGDMPPVKAFWYEGLKADAKAISTGDLDTVTGDARNLPPLLLELQKQYPDEEFDTNGTLYVGEKGILYTGNTGSRMHLLPLEKMQQITQPPRSLPRSKNVMDDFLDACRAGRRETAASFDYGARLTELVLLGNLAQHAGAGQKVEWDGPNMRVSNLPELNRWVNCPQRKGWEV